MAGKAKILQARPLVLKPARAALKMLQKHGQMERTSLGSARASRVRQSDRLVPWRAGDSESFRESRTLSRCSDLRFQRSVTLGNRIPGATPQAGMRHRTFGASQVQSARCSYSAL